jgi:ferredoxin-nitrite reductase
MLKAYLANRAGTQESFADFTRRHDIDALKALFETQASE